MRDFNPEQPFRMCINSLFLSPSCFTKSYFKDVRSMDKKCFDSNKKCELVTVSVGTLIKHLNHVCSLIIFRQIIISTVSLVEEFLGEIGFPLKIYDLLFSFNCIQNRNVIALYPSIISYLSACLIREAPSCLRALSSIKMID